MQAQVSSAFACNKVAWLLLQCSLTIGFLSMFHGSIASKDIFNLLLGQRHCF